MTRETPPAADTLAAAADTGARQPDGIQGELLVAVAVTWSLFQLWIASPLPFTLGLFIFSDTEARAVHLAFALLLAYTAFPAASAGGAGHRLVGWLYAAAALVSFGYAALLFGDMESRVPPVAPLAAGVMLLLAATAAVRPGHRRRIPPADLLLGAVAAACALYLLLNYQALAQRPGSPTALDLAVAACGLVLLLEAARRTLGPALAIIALLFIGYSFAGPLLPELLAHRGASFGRAMSQYWLSGEGVFGVALGVSTGFIFLFVLFGALLERAGAGNWFIQVAFALLGHLRGGPAKAAVVASGMTGMISGSSIANVVTTGTFTVPLMKRVGFSAEKAGAVEVASSVNGQLMPPVMGAAAFLMIEYVGIPYVEVIKHAFLPAVIAYAALLYIVHLEAVKGGMQGLPRRAGYNPWHALLGFGFTVSGLIILAGVVWYGLGWIKAVLPGAAGYVVMLLLLGSYLGLLRHAARYRTPTNGDGPLTELPEPGPTVRSGLHYLLPVIVLIWALIVERLSPGLAAFWAIAFLIFILLTQRPLLALFQGEGRPGAAVRLGGRELLDGLTTGARNMIGIGVATAAAGIVVGTVSMTGLGLVMTEVVETLSGGNLLLILLLTAFISLLLGLGLPTTANYIIVATLMAPVVVELGSQHGLIVPLIAVHLFVFYFGLLADVTPPVGLASFAAAAVSRGDPLRTGVQAFLYSLRTVALPFFFIFNPQLLLIGVNHWWEFLLVGGSALVAMLLFAAATQGWFLVRCRAWEVAALLLVAFTLFRPDFWMDRFVAPWQTHSAEHLAEAVEATAANDFLRLTAEGFDLDGQPVSRTVMLRLGAGADLPGLQRLQQETGLGVMAFGEQASVSFTRFGSQAERLGLEPGWSVTGVLLPADRPRPEWVYLPALLLLAGVAALQSRRRHRPANGQSDPLPS